MKAVHYERDGHIGRITLNRPEKRNAINWELTTELNESLGLAKADDEVRVVVVTGAGPSFCAGIDLAFFRGKTSLQFHDFIRAFYLEMTHLQQNLGKPSIAAVNGPALAAGCSIAFSCDLIIASDRAIFGYPEIIRGLMPAMHLILLPRLVGKYKAFELCFTGEPIPAREALEWGMINKVVPHEKLGKAVDEMAAKLASLSPLAVRYNKEAFYRGMDVEFKKAIADAAEVLSVLVSSEDTYEGLSAFVEKRPPVWKGR